MHLFKKAMKTILPVGFGLVIIFLSCTLSGQDISESENLIGKWYILESNKTRISDTLTLFKNLPQSISKDYYQWEFTNSGSFFTTYYKHSQLKEFIAVMENKEHDDAWFFERANNRLTIKSDNFKRVYYLLSSESDYIKLIRIE
jgi:hypothetical protein